MPAEQDSELHYKNGEITEVLKPRLAIDDMIRRKKPKGEQMRFRSVVAAFSLAILAPLSALAEDVRVSFLNCRILVDDAWNFQDGVEDAKLKFTGIYFGGECGTVQAEYLRGESINNALPLGADCTVKAKLKRRNGKALSGRTLTIRNEDGTLRAKGKTDSKGRITLNFSTLAASPIAYYLVGPRVGVNGERLACAVYSYDHSV